MGYFTVWPVDGPYDVIEEDGFGKDLEGSGHSLSRHLPAETEEKSSVRIAYVPVEIRTEHLLNTNLGRCRYGIPLSMTKFVNKLNFVALVRERTMPTELPPLVGEVCINFCGYRVLRGQRNGFPRSLVSIF
jgi:hypothetical protein